MKRKWKIHKEKFWKKGEWAFGFAFGKTEFGFDIEIEFWRWIISIGNL